MTPRTVACQAPLSMEFSRQEYGSGLPCPPQRDLPDPGIKPKSPALQADSLPFEEKWYHQEKQEDNETESMAIKGDPSEREFGYEKHPETFPHGEKEERNLFFPSRKLVAVICGSYFTCEHSTCFIHLTDATVCFSLFQRLEFLYTIV